MKRRAIRVALALSLGLAILGAAAARDEAAKKTDREKSKKEKKEPFYRRYLIAGNPLDEKIKEQEKLVEANPSSAALHNDFGNLLALRRFPKEARQQYEIAIQLDKNGYLPQYNLGIVFETEGKIGHAIRAFEKAVDKNRGFPPGLFRLGHLYEKRGWDRRAIEAYAKALRIDPGMRDPRHNPLVVDTRLLARVSLINYERDLATASLAGDAHYAEEARFRRLPYDRTIYSEEAEETPQEAPVVPATPAPPRPPAPLPAAPGQTRPQAIVPAPTSAVPPGAPIFAAPQRPALITPVPPPPTPEGATPTPAPQQ